MSVIGTLMFPEGVTFVFYVKILALLVLTSLLSFLIVGFIVLTATFITFRLGMDPDNLINPLLSSSSDLITTIILVALFLVFF